MTRGGTSKLVCSVMSSGSWVLKKNRTTPLHPQSDGLVEQFNRTLATQLVMTSQSPAARLGAASALGPVVSSGAQSTALSQYLTVHSIMIHSFL